MKVSLRALAGLCLLSFAVCAAAADRPKIGLVLGGGGARGAAHIGVLEVLERLQVPVDCVAGTSFGALVAGAWAAGVTPAEMRRAMAAANWGDMFQDNPGYTDLNFRNKRLLQRYLPGSEAGVGADGVSYPPGAVSGQKIKLFINQLVRADRGEREIQTLPVKLAIIATDIGSGERVVFREGSLTQAMRASMAVPGLVAPLEIGGRKLVDGGLVDNLPIREVRDLCAPDVVIAVNVGSPLLAAADVGSLLSVSAQMVALLTEQNVTLSLPHLGPRDIYIKPVLDGISAGDFGRFETTAERGREAAEWVGYALGPYTLGEQDWRERLFALRGEREGVPRVDEIRIEGLARVQPEVVQRYLAQRVGERLDTATLNRDLLRAYGDGWYESVDYSLVTQRERRILRVTPVEKGWGPDYLRFALNLDSTLNQGSTYGLRAAYQKTWINRLGGELLASGEIGSRQALDLQWHQPLERTHRWFAQLDLGVASSARDLYFGNQNVARYDLRRTNAELTLGLNLPLVGELRAGYLAAKGQADLDIGTPLIDEALLSLLRGRGRGFVVRLELDQLNRLYFPTDGWATTLSWYRDHGGLYTKLSADLRAAYSLGSWVLGARAAYTGSQQGVLPVFEAGTLGGFLNLSAYASGQYVADTVHYGHLRAERIIGRLPLGLRGDMRLGLALEVGRASNTYTVAERTGRLNSVAVYLGGETPFGPVYVGFGHAAAGSNNAYLFLGTP
jgi:NTE family protein